jgi:hypothetical protein
LTKALGGESANQVNSRLDALQPCRRRTQTLDREPASVRIQAADAIFDAALRASNETRDADQLGGRLQAGALALEVSAKGRLVPVELPLICVAEPAVVLDKAPIGKLNEVPEVKPDYPVGRVHC